MLPLLGLIAGTGVIAPEIDDGTVLHLLSQPISRPRHRPDQVLRGRPPAFAAGPLRRPAEPFVAAWLLVGGESGIATASPSARCVRRDRLCRALPAAGRRHQHAVTIGIIYALVWEGLIGNFRAGARQFLRPAVWARSIADQLSSSPFLATT
ncbi:hypothetical protein [Nonomuraea dietziae]|uniref:hypothetical protein n=1 Tax=Nonomuraea dietziae TaxID=65515 RepID=UPI0031D84749